MAKRTSRVRTIVKYVRRGGSAARRGVSRVGRFQRKSGFDLKSVLIGKIKQIAGAGIDVGMDVASAATDNTFDDAITSTPAKLAVAAGIEFLFGRSAHDISAGMTGSAAGDWMRRKLKA